MRAGDTSVDVHVLSRKPIVHHRAMRVANHSPSATATATSEEIKPRPASRLDAQRPFAYSPRGQATLQARGLEAYRR